MRVHRREIGERYTCECGAEVIQARSRHGNGGPITLKAPEDGRGNVLLFKATDGVSSYVVVPRPKDVLPIPGKETDADRVWRVFLNENRELARTLRLNHFADCPVAANFRRPKPEVESADGQQGEDEDGAEASE